MAGSRRDRWFLIVATAIGTALLFGLFGRALLFGETFTERDLGLYYRAAKSLIAPLVHASDGVPLWNPFFGSGQPFAANPEHEVFHPMTALFLVLPFEWAFRLQVILPPFAAAASMFALLRTLRRSQPAALFGAIGWGFGGYLLSTTNLLPILLAASLLPLVVLFTFRVTRDRRSVDIVGLALAFGLIGLAGEPSTLLMAPIFVIPGFALARPTTRGRAVVTVGAGVALGIALSGVMLLPGLHHASKTVRTAGLGAHEADRWSMPPARALDLLAPYVDRSDYLYSLYPGALATLLAIAAWTVRRRGRSAWLAVAIGGYLVALGNHLPIWPLLHRLPLLSGIRFPEKFVVLLVFPIAVASAFGLDQLAYGRERARRPLRRALAVIALAAGAAAAGLSHGAALHLALVAGTGWLLLATWRRLGRARASGLACAILTADLLAAGRPLLTTNPAHLVAAPPPYLAPLVEDRRPHLLFDAASFDNRYADAGLIRPPPQPAEWGLAMTLEKDFDLTQLRWTNESTVLFWLAIKKDRSLLEPLLARRGVTALVRYTPGLRLVDGRVELPPGQQSPVQVRLAPGSHPFAFAVQKVEIVRGGQGWMDAVARLGPAVADSALVDEAELQAFDGSPAAAEIQILDRRPQRLSLSIEGRGPGPSFVAVNQTWDDGWHATIDGVPARLLRTDVALSGLIVPAGRHQVELRYQDPYVTAGMIITLAAALACLGLVILGRRRA